METPARPPFLGRTAITGVGSTTLSKRADRSVLALATEACRRAIDDAGLEPGDVDGVASFSVLEDSVPSQAVATTLALPRPRYLLDLQLGGQAPCFLVMHAAAAIASGLARHVLVFRALKGRSGVRIGQGGFTGPATEYRYAIGFNAYPQYIAMWARRYMIETGATEEDLAAVPIAQRHYAALNERAVRREPLDQDAYFSKPYVAEPFRTPDCTVEVDGACAVLVSSTEAATSLRKPPVILQGAAYSSGPRPGSDMGDALLWDDYSRNYTSFLADDLWGSAGLSPGEVDTAQLYDCFSSSVLFALEGLGIVGRGDAGGFVRAGETSLDGKLPTNTHGGLLNEGYLHGMNTVTEAVLQLRGESGERNVDGARTAVATSGALMDGSALVLSRP